MAKTVKYMKNYFQNLNFWLECKGWSTRALRCKLAYFIYPHFYPHFYPARFDIGQEVWDDLTQQKAKVIGMSVDDGVTYHYDAKGKYKKVINGARNWAIYLDNDYLDGGRHPWEVTDLKRGY